MENLGVLPWPGLQALPTERIKETLGSSQSGDETCCDGHRSRWACGWQWGTLHPLSAEATSLKRSCKCLFVVLLCRSDWFALTMITQVKSTRKKIYSCSFFCILQVPPHTGLESNACLIAAPQQGCPTRALPCFSRAGCWEMTSCSTFSSWLPQSSSPSLQN